ncbi:MAG TPA: diguanylate cyclase [Lachnoclostridium phytofermentans]|uniref:Diguanylate cyclase n=1 Tax=Lachnoclostridium phytofermentans TaxID=66219 RepID=A0A3D2X822_9FIRM|nr:ABC transporter permease [Lachnoclostridium sp.]HCL03136.1 diguanylate cyclase [Lachnoclostridium phytofermentans]
MWKYIVKRVLTSIVILFFVSLIIYTIIRCIPTSYIEKLARERASLPGAKSYTEWLDQLRTMYGMDCGIIEGFFRWLASAVRGEFGDSWYFNIPVTAKFSSVIWDSFYLGVVSFILEIVIAIPLGILSARKQYSKTDYAVTVFALIGISLPGFFFATILKLIFSIHLGWFDLYGKVGRLYDQLDTWGKFLDVAAHFVLPIATLVIISVGSLMRYTRTNMLEVLNSDFIRTARAKGLSESTVINKHAFRNTLIPIVTIIGGTLPGLFAGAMITETLFQIPGIGYTSYLAMTNGDIPFFMFYMTFMAALTLMGNLISDILYAVVDPRVRVG